MPLLAYCIALDDQPMHFPSDGILRSKLEPVTEGGLIALCSELEKSSISATNFQEVALEFHKVLQAVFAKKAVVPFRFPTWLSADDIKAHLRQRASLYRDFLRRHADHVQMEVRVAREADSSEPVTSGAEHLRTRAAQWRAVMHQAEGIKNLVTDKVIEWRQREIPDGVRLYALVAKRSVEEFRERLKRDSIRSTGPWPATEFLE